MKLRQLAFTAMYVSPTGGHTSYHKMYWKRSKLLLAQHGDKRMGYDSVMWPLQHGKQCQSRSTSAPQDSDIRHTLRCISIVYLAPRKVGARDTGLTNGICRAVTGLCTYCNHDFRLMFQFHRATKIGDHQLKDQSLQAYLSVVSVN